MRAPRTAATDPIRPFAAADAQAVADLLLRAFQNVDRPAPSGMADYLVQVYLDAPWFDPDIASRVLVRADGAIAGFIGVSALPMLVAGRPVRTALISSLAVDPGLNDPMTGPRLLRHVRSGPQAAIVSDRSNPVAIAMLRSLGAELIRDYSLDWVRSLRPAGFAIAALASRVGVARLLAPLARPIDAALLRRAAARGEPNWAFPTAARTGTGFTDRAAADDEIAALVLELLAELPTRPDWRAVDITAILADGARKTDLGAFIARIVAAPGGKPIGLFLLHVRPGRTAHVLATMSTRGREGIVLDRLIAHAAELGAVALRGRTQPALLPALMERRAVFAPDLATLVQTSDPELLAHFRAGTAFFTGLAGEQWMRLNGDAF